MKKLLLLLTFALINCNLTPSDPKPNIIVPNDIFYCKAGCETLSNLTNSDGTKGCPESKDLVFRDGGKETCEEFCTITEKNGRALNPKCWTTLKSCDEIEACRKD